MYLDAVEQAVSIEKMNNPDFNPNSCNITKEGNLYCDGYEEKIEVEIKGEKPINGNIIFEEGKITNIRLEYKNGKVIIKDEKGNLVYEEGEEDADNGLIAPTLYTPIESPYVPSNMFDASTLIRGQAVNTDGTNTLVAVAMHSASQEINIEAGAEYILSINAETGGSCRTLCILNDGTATFQSMTISSGGRKITIPENCVAFRISGQTELMENFNMVPAPTMKIATNGDSITALPYGWSTLVANYYYSELFNKAIGGSVLASFGKEGTPSNSRSPLIERYTEMDASADICMIAIGTNDWWYSWCDIGTDSDTVTTTFKGALHTLCKGLKEMYGDKPIVFLTPIKRGEDPNATNSFGRTLEEYANAITDVCSQYDGIHVIDLYHTCPLDPSIPEHQAQFFDGNLNINEGYSFLYDDTTHPNVYGSRVQARYVLDAMKSIIGK